MNKLLREREAARIRAAAHKFGWMLDGEEFELRWREQGEMGGSENDIWYDDTTGLVWKRNRVDVMHLSWRQFFDRLLLHNTQFPEAPLTLRGFVESGRHLCPVFTQPDIEAARGAEEHEVIGLMRSRGYSAESAYDFRDARLWVQDLHCGNVLFTRAGELKVIDPLIVPV